MTAAVACPECGSPIFTEDRFCGACGSPQTPSLSGESGLGSSPDRAAKLLAELRALTAGEYEIRGEIGRGGMAVVYLAYDLRLNRKVAIKAMLPDLAFHAGMEERFKREARTAARLDHPNIVVIHSVRDSGDPLFFVMKYVEGAPLDAVIRSHAPLPISVVQGILLQLGPALQYAHDDGVVHRDVKPANILVDTRGNVQVTDFGIAKAADSAHLTRTGLAIGTPTYMCPEQCLGHPQSPASDQYAVGIVAYELLTGNPPFIGSGVATQWAHVKDVPRPLVDARPDCPASLASAVMRMLAKEPNERWPSLRDALPLIARGLSPDADAGRPALAELVRRASGPRSSLAVTPPSPIPHQVARRVEPAAAAPPRTPVAAAAIASLDVVPRQTTLEAGTTERVRCRVLDARGKEVSDVPTWSSSNPQIASVDEAGVVSAHAAGTVTIAAMVDALAAMASVEVVPATVARVNVEPSIVSVPEHGSVHLAVRAFTGKGKPLLNPPITFRSADPSVATLDASGLLTGVARGQTTAVASLGGVDTTIIVTVTPAIAATLGIVPVNATAAVGETLLLAATAADAQGHPVSGCAVTWRSLTPAIAKVDARGRVTARRAGTATIVAAADRLEARAELTVTAAAKSRFPVRILAAATVTIVAGLTIWTLVGRLKDRAPVASSASTGTLATIPTEAPAPVAAPTPAPATPTTAASPTTPTPVPTDTTVATIELLGQSPLAIEVGDVKSLIVLALNQRGDPLPTARIEWEASNPAVASVGPDGVLTAIAVGRSLVTARVGERTRVLPVDIRPASPARVAVSIVRDSLQVGDSTTASSQVFDRRDTLIEQTVAWRSSNASVATVDQGGVVHARGVGQATIAAEASSMVDSVSVVVSPASPVVSDAALDSARLASSSVRAIAPPPRAPSRTVAPRAVGALPAGVRAPSETEARTIADSIVAMIGRRVVRVAQLTRADVESGARFQQFLERNTPSARLAGTPSVTDVRATGARVVFGVVLEWRTLVSRRERTVNLEGVLSPVRGGWAIREIRFPSGFTP